MIAFYLRAATALVPFVLFAIPAVAQDSQRPVVITPPVGDFSLPPTGQTPTPRPSPTPTPTTTPTPAPIVQPIPIPAPTATATPAPRRPVPRAVPTPAIGAPQASPTPLPTPDETPPPAGSTPTPAIVATPPAAESGLPGWTWLALGGGLLLFAGGLTGWWFGRRRRETRIEEEFVKPQPVEPPAPSPGPPPLGRKSPPTPPTPLRTAPAGPAVPPTDGPLVAEMRPLRAAIRDGMVTLEFELFVHNRGPEPADNIRATLALLGANAEQDAQIASFHAAARLAAGAEPFSLAPGAIHTLNAQVSLPGEQMQVVTVQGKPMFVPIVPVTLRWYAGLSIRTLRDAFMVGTAPAQGGDKLGPLWLERAGEGFGRLAAKRYVPKAGG